MISSYMPGDMLRLRAIGWGSVMMPCILQAIITQSVDKRVLHTTPQRLASAWVSKRRKAMVKRAAAKKGPTKRQIESRTARLEEDAMHGPRSEPERTRKIHSVKCWPVYFEEIAAGRMTSNMRLDDGKDYQVGDGLIFQEFDPDKREYTNREVRTRITHALRPHKQGPTWGIHDRWVCLSISLAEAPSVLVRALTRLANAADMVTGEHPAVVELHAAAKESREALGVKRFVR